MKSPYTKVAHLLTQLHPEEAKILLEELTCDERAQIKEAFDHLEILTEEQLTATLTEFHNLLFDRLEKCPKKNALLLKDIFSSIESPKSSEKPLHDSSQTEFIERENPRTVALLLTYLPPENGANLFRHLKHQRRQQTFEALGDLAETSIEIHSSIGSKVAKSWDSSTAGENSFQKRLLALVQEIVKTLPSNQISPLLPLINQSFPTLGNHASLR